MKFELSNLCHMMASFVDWQSLYAFKLESIQNYEIKKKMKINFVKINNIEIKNT